MYMMLHDGLQKLVPMQLRLLHDHALIQQSEPRK